MPRCQGPWHAKEFVFSGGHCSDSHRLSYYIFAREAPWVILMQNRANFFAIPADLFIIHRRDSGRRDIYYIGYFCASPTLIASQVTHCCVVGPCKSFLDPTGLSGFTVGSRESLRRSNISKILHISHSLPL